MSNIDLSKGIKMNLEEIVKVIESQGIRLVICRGIPGSGKSTFAKKLPGFLHLETDMYWHKNPLNEYRYDASKIYDAHKWCQGEVKQQLKWKKNVAVSNTFTTLKEFKEYELMSEELKVPMLVVKCVGEWKDVHGVPEEALVRMRSRWVDYPGELTYTV